MDILTQKMYPSFDYRNRYTGVPNYFNTDDNREQPGLVSNISYNNAWVAHKIQPGENLDSLALKYYANPTYWWIIAYFNNIQDAFVKLYGKYDIIKIPDITGIVFGNERSY